ncbi:MAG: DNA-3-methyladenine glycosylase I [Hyphomonadaceae bacterium]|nr:DNA-3-methyladenine glycosylase I [Hyphomonadaceae bacterium]
MRHFDEILALAAQHHGSPEAVLEKAVNAHAVADLTSVPDDRYLATMTRCVFNAGFNWKVIEAKWEGFEAAFEGFDPHKVAFMTDEDLDRLVSDERIVRHGAKIKSTLENARFIVAEAEAHGSFGAFLAGWPMGDQAGLLAHLGKHGSRLGGATGQYALRFSGYDAWITSRDVCAALVREGVLDEPKATSKSALKAVDEAFNELAEQSGQSRALISRVLALSVG